MPYITRQDDISALPLSVRSLNCLRRADIHTIGAMMDYPADELINIPREQLQKDLLTRKEES